jgi:hypothetical protein
VRDQADGLQKQDWLSQSSLSQCFQDLNLDTEEQDHSNQFRALSSQQHERQPIAKLMDIMSLRRCAVLC